jgi:hypothetical protein
MPAVRTRSAPRCPHRPSAVSQLLAAVFLLAGILHFVSAQEDTDAAASGAFFYRIEDVRRYFTWGWNLIPTGIDVTMGYRLPPWFEGVETILQTTIGGGYEGFGTFRAWNYVPNAVETNTADPNGNLEFNSPNIQWQGGIRQGIAWNPAEQRNLVEAFLYYRGRYDRYLKGRHYWGSSDSRIAAIEASHEAWQSAYLGNDARGIFGNSLFCGFAYDDLHFDGRTKAYNGTYAEASVEFSPYFPSVLGASDFWRINFSTKTFWRLYEARPEAEKNVFTIYAGSYFSIDYADARSRMPLYVMQTFGGTELREGLADSVRGFEKYSWDTQLKIVHNFDLRFNLPVIYSFCGRDLLPGIVVYFDLGYGSLYWGDPWRTPGGFIGSTGIGLFLDLLDFAYVHVYTNFPLIGERIDGAPVALDLAIRLHF